MTARRIVLLTLLIGACGSPSRSVPLIGLHEPDDPQLVAGHRAFDRWCGPCHPGGAGGLGPALNDKPLPAALVRTQVRAGLGAMPAFSEADLSDERLDALLAWVKWLQDLPPPE